MDKFDNVNLLKLIFSNLALYRCNVIFNKIKSNTLSHTLLYFLKYENIFHSVGRKFTVLKALGEISYFIKLDNGDIVTEVLGSKGLIKFWKHDTFKNYKTININFTINSILEHPNKNLILAGENKVKIYNNMHDFNCIKDMDVVRYIRGTAVLIDRYLTILVSIGKGFRHKVILHDPETNYNCIKIIEENRNLPTLAINMYE
jgi:hypothetical protein